MKIWLIQISTDSMYYKKKRNSEKDKIKCSNYYVVSKIIAEQNCAKTSLILRTNFFGKSKIKIIIHLLILFIILLNLEKNFTLLMMFILTL